MCDGPCLIGQSTNRWRWLHVALRYVIMRYIHTAYWITTKFSFKKGAFIVVDEHGICVYTLERWLHNDPFIAGVNTP